MTRFRFVMLATLVACLCAWSYSDAQLLRRRAAPAPAVDSPVPKTILNSAGATFEPPQAGLAAHPVVKLFVKQRVIAGLVKNGKTRAEAKAIVDEHLTDEFLAASFHAEGVALPAAPPSGWLQWIVDNLPQILALITKLIALFGGL